MRAKYCKARNTYTIEDCQCDCPKYWKQGIGTLENQGSEVSNTQSSSDTVTSTSTDYQL